MGSNSNINDSIDQFNTNNLIYQKQASAPTATSTPPTDGNNQTELEQQWEASVPTLSPAWADIEIVGLCLFLLVMEAALSGRSFYALTDDNMINWASNRLQYLIDYSQAGDQFKALASESIEDADQIEYSQWGIIPSSSHAAMQAEFQDLRAFFDGTNDYADKLQELILQGELPLPDDDGTALFCLILVCGAEAGVEYKKGTPGFGYEFFTYNDPNYKYNGIILGPAYSYYYLCDHFGSRKVNGWFKFYNSDKINDPYNYGQKSYKDYFAIKEQAKTTWLKNDGPIFWNSDGTIDVPPDINTSNNAEDMYNNFEEDHLPPPDLNTWFENNPKPPFNPTVVPSNMTKTYSETCEMLEWMKDNPGNLNGAFCFLLYLSTLANAGVFTEYPEFADAILAIGNGTTSLVDECVDLAMMQMCMEGYTPDQASAEMYKLFPPENDDPISNEVHRETDEETAELNDDLAENPDYFNDMTEADLQTQWYYFMTDSTTLATMNTEESAMRVDMVDSTTLLRGFIALMLLLEQSSIYLLDSYTAMNEWLTEETNDLSNLENDFAAEGYFDTPENAQAWVEGMQNLQDQIDNSVYLDQTTKDNFDDQFDNIWNIQAVDSEGNPLTDESTGDPITLGDQIDEAEDSNDPNAWDPVQTTLQYETTPQSADVTDGDGGVTTNPNMGIPAGGETILQSFDTMDNLMTQQSQLVNTMIQQITQEIQMIDNMLNQILNGSFGITSMTNTMVNNQKS